MLAAYIDKATELAERYGMRQNFGLYLQEEIVSSPGAMFATARPPSESRTQETAMLGAMCYEPWLSVAVTAEGKVGPCCAFWDPKAQGIQETSFREAWLGPYMTLLRERMLTHRPVSYLPQSVPCFQPQ